MKLKEFDRQLGAIFGLAKGVLYCVIITFFAVTLSEPARQSVLQSRSGDFIARGIRHANPMLPEDIRTWLGKYIDELDAACTPPRRRQSPPRRPHLRRRPFRAPLEVPRPRPRASGAAGGQPAGH